MELEEKTWLRRALPLRMGLPSAGWSWRGKQVAKNWGESLRTNFLA